MDRITILLLRFLREELTPPEKVELEEWLSADAANRALLAELQDPGVLTAAMIELDQLDLEKHWAKFREAAERIRARAGNGDGHEQKVKGRFYPLFRRLAVAAVFAGLLGAGWWWYAGTRSRSSPPVVSSSPVIQAPEKSRATLQLSGGQKITLDSPATGPLAREGNIQVVKADSGAINYQLDPAAGVARSLLYNTVTNPRGSRPVALRLADGTRVWLNTESSLRYPVLFSGAVREVEMTGEAYFEVAKDPSKPFYVRVSGKENVQVLGTSFNIKAYGEDSVIRTTLLEGRIAVSREGESGKAKFLSVGEQAVTTTQIEIMKGVDLSQVMAWKNGRFAFGNSDLRTVMSELARWYDVDVRYEGAVPDQHFNGHIGRDLTLEQLLKTLSNSGVHYRIEPGRQVVIYP